ncbi:Tcp11-domain-containing protein, partial [Lichtheimia hyalospora FSU 10163]
FTDLGLPQVTDKATWMDFDKLTELITRPSTIDCIANIINILIHPPSKQPTQRARIFLTAYIILTCPKAILQETPISLRKRLQVAAKRLLISFEAYISCQDSNADMQQMIQMHWQGYGRLFQAWKKNDRAQLLAASTAHYNGLMDLKHTIQEKTPDGPDRREACDALEEQLRQVQAKIERLGGPVVHVPNEQPTENTIPTPPSSHNNSDDENGQHDDQEQKQRAIHMLQGISQKGGISNEQLAHDIILDPEFKLERTNGIERQVTATARHAFFDKLDEDLTQDVAGAHDTLLQVVADVRQQLLKVAPRNEQEGIHSNLDLELMRQQLAAHVCDLDTKINWIISVMQRSCAPIRDDAIKSIHHRSRTSEKLECIVDILQDMALDLANVQLRALRPHLLSMAIDYGRSKFDETMATNNEAQSLPRTQQWLQEAYNRLLSNNNNAGNAITSTASTPTYESVFQDALINLLLSPKSAAEWSPETLRLDIARVVKFQNTAQAITIVAALLTLARNFGIVDEDEHAVLAETLFTLLKDHRTSPQHLAAEIERRV